MKQRLGKKDPSMYNLRDEYRVPDKQNWRTTEINVTQEGGFYFLVRQKSPTQFS